MPTNPIFEIKPEAAAKHAALLETFRTMPETDKRIAHLLGAVGCKVHDNHFVKERGFHYVTIETPLSNNELSAALMEVIGYQRPRALMPFAHEVLEEGVFADKPYPQEVIVVENYDPTPSAFTPDWPGSAISQ